MTSISFDRARHLSFDLVAIKDLETQMGGLPVGAIVQQLQMAGVTAIIAALWAGLKHEDPTLTPASVTQLLSNYVASGMGLLPLARGLNAALEASGVFRGTADTPVAPARKKRR
jgi:hypothetical protein